MTYKIKYIYIYIIIDDNTFSVEALADLNIFKL